MSFSSLIFIALFLPVFMIASVLVRGNQRKNLVLLLFSLIFYAFAGLTKLALLLMVTMLAWFSGQRIGRALSLRRRKIRTSRRAMTFSRVQMQSGSVSRGRGVPVRGCSSRS